MQDEQSKGGRRPLPPGKKLVRVESWVTPESKQKMLTYGPEWVRGVIERARTPKPVAPPRQDAGKGEQS